MIDYIIMATALLLEAIVFMSKISYYKEQLNIKDEELLAKDKLLGEKEQKNKQKNLIIKKYQETIKELDNGNRQSKKQNHKRLQKNN